MRRTLALIACLSLPAATLAASSINRCVDAAGNTVFTDRDCDIHGARAMPRAGSPQDPAAMHGVESWSGTRGLVSGGLASPLSGCAEDIAELALRLRVALESGNVNQISSLYHWPGASSRGAESVMAALARTASKGTHAVVLEPDADFAPSSTVSVATTAAVPPPPRGLRVEHGPGGFDGYPPETTSFSITRHMGCWWIHY